MDEPIRKGYYKFTGSYGPLNYEALVYVTKIDRYTNSKIDLEKIEISGSIVTSFNDAIKKIATNKFSHIVKTTNIS